MGGYESLIMMVAMFAVLYFVMIRPDQKRRKRDEEMRAALKKGDQVTSVGGIVGKIVMVNDSTVIIETSEDRVRMELTKTAIAASSSQSSQDKKKKDEDET